jgi:hypothetical protein
VVRGEEKIGMKDIHPTAIVISSSVIGFIILILMSEIGKRLFGGTPPDYFYGLVGAFVLFILSLPAFISLFTRRLPQLEITS